MNIAFTALSSLLPQLPIVGVIVAGIVIAIARWHSHPRVSALLVIALSLELASLIIYPVLTALVIGLGTSAQTMGTTFFILGLSGGLLRAALFGLILWAAFGWRTNAHVQ
jgi:hypothetical protein